ncbi:MAG: hypothetical protein GC137_06700 [Alphaproteobacteria bacterium]|nr:hypothetical protein [Alphaproteobacteria bacterium]
MHKPQDPHKAELREIEKAFARLFSSEDGQKVLSHLQSVTFERALGAASPDQHLRYVEGQRSLVATILRLIDRGKKPI